MITSLDLGVAVLQWRDDDSTWRIVDAGQLEDERAGLFTPGEDEWGVVRSGGGISGGQTYVCGQLVDGLPERVTVSGSDVPIHVVGGLWAATWTERRQRVVVYVNGEEFVFDMARRPHYVEPEPDEPLMHDQPALGWFRPGAAPGADVQSKGTSMLVRAFTASDLDAVLAVTIETFRPFYEGYVHSLLGEEVFQHQHGRWEQDYRSELPTLHDPGAGRQMAVAEVDGVVVGLVAWNTGQEPKHGEVSLLAVSAPNRRHGVGRALCCHALDAMKADGVEVVGIGTGDDAFHEPARRLYEGLGFTKIPIAGYLGRV